MKRIVSTLIALQVLFIGTNVYASKGSDNTLKNISNISESSQSNQHLIDFDYWFYADKKLITSGSQTGYSNAPVVFQQASITQYISAINTAYDGSAGKIESFQKSNLNNGLTLNILPAAQGGFISTLVSFEYSVLNKLKKVKGGLEMPDVNSVSFKQPLYFKSGESRAIDFCMNTSPCTNPDYRLVIKASIHKSSNSL
jgi:hypothetical protein